MQALEVGRKRRMNLVLDMLSLCCQDWCQQVSVVQVKLEICEPPSWLKTRFSDYFSKENGAEKKRAQINWFGIAHLGLRHPVSLSVK